MPVSQLGDTSMSRSTTVKVDEEPDQHLQVDLSAAERQTFPDQMGDPKPQGRVEPLDELRASNLVQRAENDAFVGSQTIGMTPGFQVGRGEALPESEGPIPSRRPMKQPTILRVKRSIASQIQRCFIFLITVDLGRLAPYTAQLPVISSFSVYIQPMNPDAELPLTMRQIREHGVLSRDVVLAARQHVGVAGLEQTAALERIVAVGRSQPSISRALKRIAQTLEDAHTGTSGADTQELLDASREQLLAVQQFEVIVSDALRTVASMPIEEISVQVLGEIDLSAKEQLATLERLVQEVQDRSSSQPQIDLLERVGEGVHQALESIEVQEASGQVTALSLTSQGAVSQIAALVHAPTEQQIAALDDLANAARAQADLLREQELDEPGALVNL